MNRRNFLSGSLRGSLMLALGGVLGAVTGRARARNTVWQIDPWKCTQCGRCATEGSSPGSDG